MSTLTVNVYSTTGDILDRRSFSDPVTMHGATVEFARFAVSRDYVDAVDVAYVVVLWDGTHVDTLTPEWLSIEDADEFDSIVFADSDY